MQITVTGNIASFQYQHQTNLVRLGLSVTPRNGNNPGSVDFIYNTERRNNMITPDTLWDFVQKTKGMEPERVALLFMGAQGGNGFVQDMVTQNPFEPSLLKSLFLIYDWTEYAFTDPHLAMLRTKVYNEFIIDYSGRPEPQRDIYFIGQQFCTPAYEPFLQRLVELNLLAKCDFISTIQAGLSTYFIPLVKPGVPRNLFAHGNDILGNQTYNLWKNILNARDLRITNWMNSRF